ncbi:MAG: four helix bundle protein [Patescibacteria group bacterium]
MAQLNFHNSISFTPPPPTGSISIIQKFLAVYKIWNEYRNHLPKKSRHTIGTKIDSLFLDTIELFFIASYLSKQEKIIYLRKASGKLDLLKFFLQIAWEIKSLDNKKYIILSEHLGEIGQMLGGWMRQSAK